MDKGMSGAGAGASGDVTRGASPPAAATTAQTSSGSARRRLLMKIALRPLPATACEEPRQASQTKAPSFVRAYKQLHADGVESSLDGEPSPSLAGHADEALECHRM
jgi:hypothetical protein